MKTMETAAVQLSVATGVPTGGMPEQLAVRDAGTNVNTGDLTSFTVMICSVLTWLPQLSVAVQRRRSR